MHLADFVSRLSKQFSSIFETSPFINKDIAGQQTIMHQTKRKSPSIAAGASCGTTVRKRQTKLTGTRHLLSQGMFEAYASWRKPLKMHSLKFVLRG